MLGLETNKAQCMASHVCSLPRYNADGWEVIGEHSSSAIGSILTWKFAHLKLE